MSTADLTALDSQWKYALHYNCIRINKNYLLYSVGWLKRLEYDVKYDSKELNMGDNCIVFENFTASIGDLMVSNRVYCPL
jgi:hypothetical protein